MIIRINKNKRKYAIIKAAFALFLFSSTVFWEENSLDLLLASGIVIIALTVITIINGKIYSNAIINCRVIWWIVANFIVFEIYGLIFLRAGSFNWDFVGFNGVLLVCISIMCLSIPSTEELVNIIATSCKIGIFATAIYIYANTINFSNISFGTRFGDALSGNVNTVATCFAMMYLPVIYTVAIKKKRDIFGIICCLVALVCMLMTGSKKGMLVILISFIMIMFLYKKPLKYFIFPIIIIVGIYAVFNVPELYNTVGYRIVDMLASFGIGTAVTAAQSTSIRKDLIVMGLKSFWNSPIFGGGMNYFQFINNARYYSHNNFVEILNGFGVIGLALFYGISLKSLRFFCGQRKRVYQDKESIYIFCITMIVMKLTLDMAMVSFSSLGIYYLPFLFPAMIMYKERRLKQERGKASN
ncbi:O-antigen ligase family protein [Vallitalea okinawensis]|uniref:O-antigen ligase family protein n=1 Tax=Vallitalea okinawensis TaxID=2078660 RepID=UPI000CFB8288|nr:O-antigen ligase family protein [Vallitalea okinawensis]